MAICSTPRSPSRRHPFTLIGLPLAIFLGFRNNTAYDRYWEGRKLWGEMVICARTLARQCQSLIRVDTVLDPGNRDETCACAWCTGPLPSRMRCAPSCAACRTMPQPPLAVAGNGAKSRPCRWSTAATR
jgi:hypothetical protein